MISSKIIFDLNIVFRKPCNYCVYGAFEKIEKSKMIGYNHLALFTVVLMSCAFKEIGVEGELCIIAGKTAANEP